MTFLELKWLLKDDFRELLKSELVLSERKFQKELMDYANQDENCLNGNQNICSRNKMNIPLSVDWNSILNKRHHLEALGNKLIQILTYEGHDGVKWELACLSHTRPYESSFARIFLFLERHDFLGSARTVLKGQSE